ncbi:MAG: hypothetical protein ABH840_00220 [Nanoarchaeota archaeon]
MAETLENECTTCGAREWHWNNVQKDLVEQGGLEDKEVMIDPSSVHAHGCKGEYRGNQFHITWVANVLLLLTSKEYNQTLVDAFSKVVDYKPFVRYQEPSGEITTEWDNLNPKKRYDEIWHEGKRDITLLED